MIREGIAENSRKMYTRPIIVSLGVCISGEFLLFIIYGLLLFPQGNLLYKFLWTVVFCGIGMGATVGTFVNLFIIDRYIGIKAIIFTILLTLAILGILCNLLCLQLDLHFHYFGAETNPILFSIGSIAGSVVAGLIIALLLFSEKGDIVLDRFGI
ncbi:MAG: hypothetical protein ACYTFW_17710 [Planctomycetota bacterium]|jgi:hypothetical protein